MARSRRRRDQNENTKTFEELLQEVNRRHVRIKKNDRHKNNSILNSVLDEFLGIMRNVSALFKSMKPKLEYLGSYFDGLRVGEPTEYDINVILTIHINYNKIHLDATETQHGYTFIKMPPEFRRLSKTPDTANKGFKDTEVWCDKSYRLSVKKFKSWMQGVVDAALNTLPRTEDRKRMLRVKDRHYKIDFKTSGPANTITIYLDNDNVIDVDLVPTLLFKLPKMPIQSNIDFTKVQKTNLTSYFAVPKPSDNEYSWRLAFPYQERYYINSKDNLKSTLKLLKLLRDTQGFQKLASYFIKSLFLWQVQEETSDFWKKNSLSYLVLYMIKNLKKCLEAGVIKNFWCSDHNLLEKVKPKTCQNWANRLSYIINDIERNKEQHSEIVLKYFTENKN